MRLQTLGRSALRITMFGIVAASIPGIARAADPDVRITNPTTTIPLAPGSIGATGWYVGSGTSVLIEIYAADENGDPTGSVLSSGSTAVTPSTTRQSWAITLNSPATQNLKDYVLVAYLLKTNGQDIADDDELVTSQQ